MKPAEFIARYRPKCFYHFTDSRNLSSIKANGGLLALSELRARKIEIPCSGGNDWSHEADIRIGLHAFVHLCFFPEHPMEYVAREKEKRIKKSVFLQISTDVLNLEGILLTPDVSNKAGVETLNLKEASGILDFPVIYGKTDWTNKVIQTRRQKAKKYELLIPSFIPLKFITGI